MGTGGVFRRKSDGRWIAQVSSGGRSNRTVRRKVGRTRDEAKGLLAGMLAEAGVVDPQMTTGDFLRSWLVTASRSVKASTLQTYEIAIRRQLAPNIGAVRLSRLDAGHVEALVRTLSATMSPKGVRNVLSVLGRALTVAERQGRVRRNVARLVDLPRVSRREPEALTVADVHAIRAAVAGDRLEALYVLALASGLRQAELLGLRWADWDRKAGTVRVTYSLDRIAGKYVMVEPKTRRSRRTVALPGWANDALACHRTAQLAERIAAGRETEEGLIFVSPKGRPINQGWLTKHWRTLSRAAGIDVTFHGLRHGQASLLVALGVHPRVIAERLGHSTVAMAMDRYAHVAQQSDHDVAALLDRAVSAP